MIKVNLAINITQWYNSFEARINYLEHLVIEILKKIYVCIEK